MERWAEQGSIVGRFFGILKIRNLLQKHQKSGQRAVKNFPDARGKSGKFLTARWPLFWRFCSKFLIWILPTKPANYRTLRTFWLNPDARHVETNFRIGECQKVYQLSNPGSVFCFPEFFRKNQPKMSNKSSEVDDMWSTAFLTLFDHMPSISDDLLCIFGWFSRKYSVKKTLNPGLRMNSGNSFIQKRSPVFKMCFTTFWSFSSVSSAVWCGEDEGSGVGSESAGVGTSLRTGRLPFSDCGSTSFTVW